MNENDKLHWRYNEVRSNFYKATYSYGTAFDTDLEISYYYYNPTDVDFEIQYDIHRFCVRDREPITFVEFTKEKHLRQCPQREFSKRMNHVH